VSMRIRVGPVSVSSTGRVGVKAGPVYVAGGGRRRRSSGSSGSSGAGAALFVLLIVVAIVIFAVMWPLSLWGHAIGLTPSWHQLMHRNHLWMHQHYPLVVLRYFGAFVLLLLTMVAVATPFIVQGNKRKAEQQQLAAQRVAQQKQQAVERAAEEQRQARIAHERWLAGPPPPLTMPGRFTQAWFARNLRGMHPGQIPVLMDELRRRGWSDGDIESRVNPYLPIEPAKAQAKVGAGF
jgi:hypothetical protein